MRCRRLTAVVMSVALVQLPLSGMPEGMPEGMPATGRDHAAATSIGEGTQVCQSMSDMHMVDRGDPCYPRDCPSPCSHSSCAVMAACAQAIALAPGSEAAAFPRAEVSRPALAAITLQSRTPAPDTPPPRS